MTAKVFNYDLTEKLSKSAEVSVGADGKTEAFKIDFPNDLSKIYFLRLKLEDNSGDEITPAYWDDNYFSLFPGEGKKIKVRFRKEDLDKASAILKVDGWNADI